MEDQGSYVVLGCPRDCYDTCMLRVYTEGGRISRVVAGSDRHTQGILCPRAAKDVERVYSSLRVLYPSVNVGNGVFRKVNWDYALNLLVSRLRDAIESYGVESILFLEYAGNRGIITRYASRRLWNFLGVTQTDRSICNYSGAKALKLVYGSTYGLFPDDIDSLSTAVIWGFNPAVSAIHLWRRIRGVKDRGGAIITIDVRETETAKQSTYLLKVRPGSDGYLALGVARYLVDRGYIDRDFIERYAYGFDQLAKHLEKYTLDLVESVTGIPKIKIIEFAEVLANDKPFAIFIGYGLQRRHGGGEIVRSISVLPALLGIHRGFYYSNTDGLPIDLAAVDGSSRWGPRRVVSMEKVGVEIARGEYKFVYIHLHNPVATLPNSGKVLEGFRREDVFVVVHETHWSDTARAADLVLPAPTFYEKTDLVFSYLHNTVYLNTPAIDPLGESLGEYQLMCEIAKKLRLGNYQDLCLDIYEVMELAVGRDVIEKLMKEKYAEPVPRPRSEYQTPTKRIELRSTLAEREGLPPLPEPPEGDRIEEDELLLVSSAHPLYIHTQFEDIYGLQRSELHVSVEDAKKLNLVTGDIVEVQSGKGCVVLRVRMDSGLPQGVAWVPRQAYTIDGKRVNVILDDGVDTYGGAVLNSTRVKIRKVGT